MTTGGDFETIDLDGRYDVRRPGYLGGLIVGLKQLGQGTKLAAALGLLLAQSFSLHAIDLAVGNLTSNESDYAAATAIPCGLLSLASLALIVSASRAHRSTSAAQTPMITWAAAALGVWAAATVLLELVAAVTGLAT